MRIATFNLRHHADRWNERFPLVVEMLLKVDADVIGFQEVSLKLGKKNQAQLIADAMNTSLGQESYQVYFSEGRDVLHGREGIAILSRSQWLTSETIPLPCLWRVAQMITVNEGGRKLGIINTHLHHEPLKEETIRFPQAKAVKSWAESQPVPCIVIGDFNAQPDSSTIRMMKQDLSSAFESIHGSEPAYTWPTPLVDFTTAGDGYEMIDYIFYDANDFKVNQCDLIGTEPAWDDASLYPSDHFGLAAEVEIRQK